MVCLSHSVKNNSIQFNSIQLYLYSAITIQLSLGALQSPEPDIAPYCVPYRLHSGMETHHTQCFTVGYVRSIKNGPFVHDT